MVRSLFGFLIIVVIFLAGMVVGIGKESNQSIGESIKLIDIDPDFQDQPVEMEQVNLKEKHNDQKVNQVEQETPKHFRQVVASSLESIVKGFYDMGVRPCYAFTNLFF